MARGYPDYFGTSVFPYVGKIVNDLTITTINAGLNGMVVTLLGKRHIIDVRFDIGGLLDHSADSIGIIIDDIFGRVFTFQEIAEGFYQTLLPTLIIPVYLNPEFTIMRGYFCGNFTVGTKLQVWYHNTTAENQAVQTNIMSSPII